jgi:hypothetical protein
MARVGRTVYIPSTLGLRRLGIHALPVSHDGASTNLSRHPRNGQYLSIPSQSAALRSRRAHAFLFSVSISVETVPLTLCRTSAGPTFSTASETPPEKFLGNELGAPFYQKGHSHDRARPRLGERPPCGGLGGEGGGLVGGSADRRVLLSIVWRAASSPAW